MVIRLHFRSARLPSRYNRSIRWNLYADPASSKRIPWRLRPTRRGRSHLCHPSHCAEAVRSEASSWLRVSLQPCCGHGNNAPISKKSSCTPSPVFADASANNKPSSSAYCSPSSRDVFRAASMSDLFPTSMMTMDGSACRCSSRTHDLAFSNDVYESVRPAPPSLDTPLAAARQLSCAPKHSPAHLSNIIHNHRGIRVPKVDWSKRFVTCTVELRPSGHLADSRSCPACNMSCASGGAWTILTVSHISNLMDVCSSKGRVCVRKAAGISFPNLGRGAGTYRL